MYKTTTRNKSKVTNAYPSIPSSILKADCYPFNPDGLRNVSFNIVFPYQMLTRMNDDSTKTTLYKNDIVETDKPISQWLWLQTVFVR